MTELTPEEQEIWRKRQERALRWGRASSLRDYPTVGLDAETDATLAAEPPAEEPSKRRRKDAPADEN